MTTTLFVMPLKKGKKANYKDFINELLTSKKEEYKDLLVRYDLNTLKMWIHTLDGKDYAMFIHEMGSDAAKRLEGWSSSTHPFDQWFNQQLMDCYDIKNIDDMPLQPEFFGELDAGK